MSSFLAIGIPKHKELSPVSPLACPSGRLRDFW
jgi:hypothetical protein